MRLLLGVIVLMGSSCATSVYRCEFYRPSLESTPAASIRRSVQTAVVGILSPTPVAVLAATRLPTVIRCQHRVRRYYAGGLILPVIPLFGLFGDPKDRAIILEISHGPDVVIDAKHIHGQFVGNDRPIAVSATGCDEHHRHEGGERLLDEEGEPIVSRVRDYYALDAPYSAGDEFTLDVPLTLEDGSHETVTVMFTRERHTLWDRWGRNDDRFPMKELRPFGVDSTASSRTGP